MSFDDLLNEMKAEYLEALPRRIDLLKQLLITQSGDPNWYQLEVEFHKLKGTGKTYGFPAVSELCAVFESLAQKKDPADTPAFTQAIHGLEKIWISENAGTAFDLEDDRELADLIQAKRKK